MNPPDPLLAHYQQIREETRLREGVGPLELVRTQEILQRYLPPPPQGVLDVGGGPGVYAAWLKKQGYQVHLVDPVPQHVEQARQVCHAELGDARSLPCADNSVAVVLLMGPLYHLTERNDRLLALREARRVLHPGGPLFAAAISRFASLMDGLTRGLIDDPAFQPILSRDLEEGQHRNESENPEFFTDAFFHRPAELRQEVEEAGFTGVEVFGVEGPVWIAPDFATRWQDVRKQEQLLELARRVEREPELMALSMHLLAVARA